MTAIENLSDVQINILRGMGRVPRREISNPSFRARDAYIQLAEWGLIEYSTTPGGRKQWATITEQGRALLPSIERRDQTRAIEMRARAIESSKREAVRMLLDLPDDARVEVFGQFCVHCGAHDPGCQCANDE